MNRRPSSTLTRDDWLAVLLAPVVLYLLLVGLLAL